jgi:hypothetical protein
MSFEKRLLAAANFETAPANQYQGAAGQSPLEILDF